MWKFVLTAKLRLKKFRLSFVFINVFFLKNILKYKLMLDTFIELV